MPAFDDAFLHFLVSLSGQAISFLPGSGGLDDALNSLVFQELCGRYHIACAPLAGAGSDDDGLLVVGSMAARRRANLGRRPIVVLPGSLSQFEEIDNGFDAATTVFWRDRASLRMAELRGAARERAVLCHDLAIHLDVAWIRIDSGNGKGSLTLDIDDQGGPANGDRIRLHLDGSDDRWMSVDACRDAVRNVALLMADCAEIVTDSPGLAILAAKIGKAVRLSPGVGRSTPAVFRDTIAPLYPFVTLARKAEAPQNGQNDPADAAQGNTPAPQGAIAASTEEVERLKTLLKAARRQAEFVAQERDQLFVLAADLRDKDDAETVMIARSYREAKERAEDAERRAIDRFIEAEARAIQGREAAMSEAEARRRELAERHAVVEGELAERLAAVEGERDTAISSAEARGAAAREAAARDAAARAAAEGEAATREAALRRRLTDLDAAFEARTRQTLMLQDAVDERDARALATERRIARMRALIDAQTASGDAASRDVEALRRRLDAVLSSASWRVTRPLRGIMRVVRRLTGAGGRGGNA